MEKPLVTVIVPVYNVKQYLSQCLESVINQTYYDLEILVIDDGSTDGSGDICDAFAQRDNRISVYHTDNHGLASARNLGISLTKGSFILFLDSDDWIELHTIETLLNKALQTDADVVAANAVLEYVGKTIHPSKQKEPCLIFHGQDILPAMINGYMRDRVWNKLYRKECIKNLRFPDGRNYEDVATTWKLIRDLSDKNGTVVILAEELFHFRMRRSSITHTKTMNNLIDRWEAYFEKYSGLPAFQEQLRPSCFSSIGAMWNYYYGFTPEEKRIISQKMQEMQLFSTKNFKKVMTGNDPVSTKIVCSISQHQGSLLMWFCFYCNKIHMGLKEIKKNMYD